MCVCVCVCVCVCYHKRYPVEKDTHYFVAWTNQFIVYASNTCSIGLMSRVFTYFSGDRGSIPGRVVPNIQVMGLDAALLNVEHYRIMIKGKVQGMEEHPLPHLGVVAIEKGAFGLPPTETTNFTFILLS